ncbi:hypothetical protein CHUAL_003934 [Chamberlinius hualienensis]
MNFDADTHLCLKCQTVFNSLDSYVEHRKNICNSSKPSSSTAIKISSGENGEETENIFFKIDEVFSVAKCNDNAGGDTSTMEDDSSGENISRKRKVDEMTHGKSADEEDHAYVIKVNPRKRLKAGRKKNVAKRKNSGTHWKKREVNDDLGVETTSSFKCSVCSLSFDCHTLLVEHWNDDIEAHNKIDSDNRGFKCSACGVQLKTLDEVKEHLSENGSHTKKVEDLQEKKKDIVISISDFIYCLHCDWVGKRQQALNFHMKWKHEADKHGSVKKERDENGEMYKCSRCLYSTKRRTSLLAHQRRVHGSVDFKVENDLDAVHDNSEGGEYSDDDDSDWTRKGDGRGYDRPKRKYSKTHVCSHCDATLPSQFLLIEHVKTEHPDRRLHCDICSEHFELESLFEKHKNSRLHKYHTDGLTENTGESTGEDYACDQCKFKSFSKSGLLFHLAMHQGPVDFNDEKVVVEDENFDCNKRSKYYRCPECGEIVKVNLLRSHLVTHTGEKPFPCQFCAETFTAKVTLASHVRTRHREKKFSCDYCPYKTQRRAKLAAHLEVHQEKAERVRKCLCEMCGAGFFNGSSLKHHMRLHLPSELGGKTQICSFEGCRLSFRSPSELVIHTRTHTGERPYLCGECGYSAKTKHQLTKHERSHNGQRPFKCRFCSYAAALSSQLLRHMRIHTGAKPYSCPYCNYTCNTHENLRKHVLKSKKHVGLSVYKCPHCDFGCNLATELKNHMFNSHGDVAEKSQMSDNAFSSVVSGIFSRTEDKKDVDQPTTPYTPRTEKPGYREKMKQTWKPKSLNINDENPELTIIETESEDTGDYSGDKDVASFAKLFVENHEEGGVVLSTEDGVEVRQIHDNFTVVVRNGDDDEEEIKCLLENDTIVVPIEGSGSASIPLTVLNNIEMDQMVEASDENGATVYLCMSLTR